MPGTFIAWRYSTELLSAYAYLEDVLEKSVGAEQYMKRVTPECVVVHLINALVCRCLYSPVCKGLRICLKQVRVDEVDQVFERAVIIVSDWYAGDA